MQDTNEYIINYLRSVRTICPGLSVDAIAAIESAVALLTLKKKAHFIKAEKVQPSIGYISEGLVRTYYIDDRGEEKTVGFFSEGEYATHYPSFITATPGKYFIQCLEPCSFVTLTLNDLQSLYRQYPAIERYGRLIAEDVLIKQQSRIESFIFNTAEERYLRFIEQYPGLFNRVSLSHLCSYLGIERQSLTRIRQKLARS